MSLSVPTRLGPYEITALLGAGGMGEVYRARDTRIGREVALKVLPASYSADPDRLRRFEQEARAAGALNHPNVLTLYDVGRHDGTPYIVSELLDGETLRVKLARGPLSVSKALDYAVQIARGLAAAHDRGIVHRDLKPENVFVTRDERVKILDFGIAKLIEPARPDEAIDEAATATRGTEAGTVVGTAGYMSPEQVRGRPADHRSDLFSFGAILHEMLTGRRTFKGESGVETMNAVLNGEPSPILEVNPQVPPLLERIVRRCLEKDPENRFQSARDLAFALEATEGSPRPPVLKAKRGIAWAVVVLAAVTAVITIVFLQRRDPEERRPLRASILPPENTSFVSGGQVHPALSPDGRRIAFLARNREGKIWLWVRALSERAPQPVAETDMFALPFWAPDGRQLGFCAGGKLKKVDLATSAVQDLCDAPRQRGATWNRDGVILSPLGGDVIYRVPASGGTPAPVTRRDSKRGDIIHRWPFFLPDGRHFLFVISGRTDEEPTADVYVGSLDSEETRLLLRDASNAEYVAPGHLVFARQGNLLAVPFDANRLALGGEPVLIARDVAYVKSADLSAFSTSSNGILAYQTAPVRESRLVWLDRAGRDVGSVEEPDRAGTIKRTFGSLLRVSPDGRSIAFLRLDPTQNGHIWVHDSARGNATRVTFEPGFYAGVVWSPEGQRLVFLKVPSYELREKALNGAGGERTLMSSSSSYPIAPVDWSRDGRFIVYRLMDPKTAWDLWAMPLSGEPKPWPIVRTPFNESDARVSPDGRWMVYTADESGRPEVYLRSFPDSQAKSLVSAGGGSRPCWRADGRELFYFAPDGKLMVVEVKPGERFDFAAARPLFTFPPEVIDFDRFNYDVRPDGQRFLANLPHGREAPPSITLVFNWSAELNR